MKITVADAAPRQLDLLIAMASGNSLDVSDPEDLWITVDGIAELPFHRYTPSGDREFCSSVLEHENLQVRPLMEAGTTEGGKEIYRKIGWVCSPTPRAYWMTVGQHFGSTPQEAIARCHVATKLGSEVSIPDEWVPALRSVPGFFAPWDAAALPRAAEYKAPIQSSMSIEEACALIEAADDAAADGDYMLDAKDCISVLKGTWKGPMANHYPQKPASLAATTVTTKKRAGRRP